MKRKKTSNELSQINEKKAVNQNLSRAEIKKKYNEEKKRKKAEKKLLKKLPLTILDLIPIKCAVDGGETGIELTTGGFFNIYQIISQDFNSALDMEILIHMDSWDKYYRTEAHDVKLESANMPIDLEDNIKFMNHKINVTKNPQYKEILEEYKREFTEDLRDREDKEYFIFIFADTYDNLIKCNAKFETAFVSQGMAQCTDLEKKIEVLQRFFNPFNKVPRPNKNTI